MSKAFNFVCYELALGGSGNLTKTVYSVPKQTVIDVIECWYL